jgi:hypothetical protein
MSRYTTGKGDTPQITEGDSGFVGLNMKMDVDKVPAAILTDSRNKRLRRGVAETRPPWVTPVALNGPVSIDGNGAVLTRLWATIYGESVYSNPNVADGTGVNNNEWLVLATDTGIWLTAEGWYPVAVPMPAGETISGRCDFAEFEGDLILFRGATAAILVWKPGMGTGAGAVVTGFQYPVQTDVTNEGGASVGIFAMPQADYGVVFANRLFIPVQNSFGTTAAGQPLTGPLDAIAASDILDYTHYDAILNEFVINSGTNEALVGLLPYTGAAASLLVFKERSIWLLAGVYGDLSSVQLQAVSTTLGSVARKSIINVGADVMFLSESPAGVYRVTQVGQFAGSNVGSISTSAVPVSDPIEPLIKRINWSAASGAVAVLFNEYYFLAVPLDGSTSNNCVLVYNTVGGKDGNGAWESYDSFAASASLDGFQITNWQGARKLFATDHGNGRVYLYDDQALTVGEDQIGSTWVPISDLMTTRGYAMDDALGLKGMKRVYVAIGTLNPNYSVSLNSEGMGMTVTLANVTKARSAYDLWGVAPYNTTNANNDFSAPGREDYSVVCPVILGSVGVQLDQVQERLERWPARGLGRWATITVANSQGYVAVRDVGIEGIATQHGPKGSL